MHHAEHRVEDSKTLRELAGRDRRKPRLDRPRPGPCRAAKFTVATASKTYKKTSNKPSNVSSNIARC
jgi:hypothetical protein